MTKTRSLSSKAGKQRKRFFNAPAHIKHKIMTCKLSSELKTKHSIARLPVKKGDFVQVVRGKNVKKNGVVLSVDKRTFTLKIAKVEVEKISGQTSTIPIHYSNCVISKLKTNDPKRELMIQKRLSKGQSVAASQEKMNVEA